MYNCSPRQCHSPCPKPAGMSHLHAHHLIVLLGEQQDAAHVGLIVVERVQLRGCHVEGSCLREAVVQLLVERQEIDVMHRDVVGVVAALQEAHVDQGCPVKPATGLGTLSATRSSPQSLHIPLSRSSTLNVRLVPKRGHTRTRSSPPSQRQVPRLPVLKPHPCFSLRRQHTEPGGDAQGSGHRRPEVATATPVLPEAGWGAPRRSPGPEVGTEQG